MNIQLLGIILFSKKDNINATFLFGNLSKIDSSLLDKHTARWSNIPFFFENLENVLQCDLGGHKAIITKLSQCPNILLNCPITKIKV